MGIIETIAERRITEAMEAGEFDGLAGAGRPQELDVDDPFVPEELRTAYRVLRNAGFVPPEVEARREQVRLTDLLRATGDPAERNRARRRLDYLQVKLERARGSALPLRYETALLERLS